MGTFLQNWMMLRAQSAPRGGSVRPYYGPDDYIQNGLVFQLDGIDKGENAGSWTDLIGGHIFQNSGAVADTDGWRFNGSDAIMTNSTFAGVADMVGTIEVCASGTGIGSSTVIFSGNAAGVLAYGPSTRGLIWSTSSRNLYALPPVEPLTISVNSVRCLANGSVQSLTSNSDNWGHRDVNSLGRRPDNYNYALNGKIYAIRMYNRILTEAEMRYNQTVDRIRFGFSPYILFADPVVEQICATNWGDGIGITPSQAAAVTSQQFGTTFQGNTQIVSFDELQYFTGLTYLNAAFMGCASLKSVVFPPALTELRGYVFVDCAALENVVLPDSLISISGLCFTRCYALQELTIPPLVTSIDWQAFLRCSGLVNLVVLPPAPPSIGSSILKNADNASIYVPYSSDHSILSAYQTATNWSDYASRIYELNPDGTIPS